MSAKNVAIINSGGANIASLEFALARLGSRSVLTSDPGTITAATHVILPGVGAAANAMQTLQSADLQQLIPRLTQPVLGICLGMQLLAQGSEEDDAACLGIVPATAQKMTGSPQNPIPHMGWAPVRQRRPHPLFDGISDLSYFYFLHSYALPVDEYTLASATHDQELSAVLSHGNFLATQFHPERSSTAGARLLQNFLAM